MINRSTCSVKTEVKRRTNIKTGVTKQRCTTAGLNSKCYIKLFCPWHIYITGKKWSLLDTWLPTKLGAALPVSKIVRLNSGLYGHFLCGIMPFTPSFSNEDVAVCQVRAAHITQEHVFDKWPLLNNLENCLNAENPQTNENCCGFQPAEAARGWRNVWSRVYTICDFSGDDVISWTEGTCCVTKTILQRSNGPVSC